MKANINNLARIYRYCPLCGGKMQQAEQSKLCCSNCGKNQFIMPNTCTSIIITNNQNQILLAKRKIEPKKDFWDLPGGFLQPNETAEDGAIREIKEELGIDIEKLEYVGSAYDTYLYQEIDIPTLSIVFTTRVSDEKLTPQDDVSMVQFFDQEDIPFEKIAFGSMAEAVKIFLKNQ